MTDAPEKINLTFDGYDRKVLSDFDDFVPNLVLNADYTRADLTPSVKPLEWVEWEHTGRIANGRKYLKRALTRVSNYFLMQRLSDGLFIVSHKLLGSEQHVGKTEAEAMQKAQEEQNRLALSALTFTPSDKNKEIERLREALIEIERVYYNEGENVKRRAARMRALASEALEERG